MKLPLFIPQNDQSPEAASKRADLLFDMMQSRRRAGGFRNPSPRLEQLALEAGLIDKIEPDEKSKRRLRKDKAKAMFLKAFKNNPFNRMTANEIKRFKQGENLRVAA